MDGNKKGKKKGRFFGNIGELIKAEAMLRKNDKGALLSDATALAVAFVFAGCHIAFGAYPLHIAFLAVLPQGVFVALIGGVVGSLVLGEPGVAGALGAIVIVFLRAVLSSMHANKDEPFMFREPLLLRICAAIIGSFVSGIYIIIDTGIGFLSVACLLAYILLSSAFSFVFFGVFDCEGGVYETLSGRASAFARGSEEGKYSFPLFAISFLAYIFFISMSLRKYDIFGISPAYIFSSSLTLFFAKKFGKLPAMAVGFVSSFILSPLYAVGFALMGLTAGALFTIGVGYGVFFGGCVLFLWSLYTGGVMGLLSVLPEYSSSALVITPLLKRVSGETEEKNEEKEQKPSDPSSRDMVNTTVMSYISKRNEREEDFPSLIADMGAAVKRYKESIAPPREGARGALIDTVSEFCRGCENFVSCARSHPTPCMECIDKMLSMVYISPSRASAVAEMLPSYCREREALCSRILSLWSANLCRGAVWEEYELISVLLSEARAEAEERYLIDDKRTERLVEILAERGMYCASAAVLGVSSPHLIFAGEDKDGSIITSGELRARIEADFGIALGVPEYYRKGSVALCEVGAEPVYLFECVSCGRRGREEVVSGDSSLIFSCGTRAYSLISDGMGSGEIAVDTSRFVCDFLERGMLLGAKKSTLLHALNKYVLECGEECSASIDLFEFDTVSGEGCFYKCGAADSYIKRGNSIFRIRSETAPIGLMRSIDAERIRVEIKEGDYIIMISDGINQPPIDAAWLLEGLHGAPTESLSEYADRILNLALVNNTVHDDMTVTVGRVGSVSSRK